ncbi:MAG: ABC transporter permease, partial [Alistipes sp.]
FSGFAVTVLIGYSPLPAVVAKPLVIVVGMLGGALVGGLIGVLKHKFNINEVVSSIMLNYIFQYVISFAVYTYYLDPVSRQSKNVTDAARLTLMNVPIGNLKMDLPLGFILAVAAVFLVRFFLVKTRLGYEIKTVGAGIHAARYAGINVGRTMVASMAFSGALAGLAGVTYYLGYLASIQPGTLTTIGFDSIAVSLLGNSNAIGVLFASLLITIITKGSTYMTSQLGVTVEIASVIIGLLLLFSACGAYIRYLARRSLERINDAALEAKSEVDK